MLNEIKKQYCPICESKTDHVQGCFKCKDINGNLFHYDTSLSDCIEKISVGFKDFVITEKNGLMNKNTPEKYLEPENGEIDFEELFSPQIRSLKCTECHHLIKLSRLP